MTGTPDAYSASDSSRSMGGGPEDLYCCAPLMRFRLSRSSDLVYSPLHRHAHLSSTQDADLLSFCSAFLTLSDHADRAARELGVPADDVLLIIRARRPTVPNCIRRPALRNVHFASAYPDRRSVG